MRLPIIAVLFSLTLALAGCGKETPKDDKDKKGDPIVGDGRGKGPNTPQAPASVAGVGTPTQQVAQQLVIDLRKPEAIKLDRVSSRFLKIIGKPLSPLPDDQAKKFNTWEAEHWLQRVAASIGPDARISPPTGFLRGDAAVFVGTFESAAAPKGRYLIRLVEEGGQWKLDWFQASVISTEDLAAGTDPFQDFSAQAAADLVAGGPMDVKDRAPLAAAILSSQVRASLEVNQPEDAQGYDYKRGILATRMESFLGEKVESYARAASSSGDAYKLEFTLVGGAKKTVNITLVKGDAPGVWVVDEIKH